jgi:hypothetical protein
MDNRKVKKEIIIIGFGAEWELNKITNALMSQISLLHQVTAKNKIL